MLLIQTTLIYYNKEYPVDSIEIYTTQDIQKIFKCGKRWAYELMQAPSFPSIKVGGRYIVERGALENWLQSYVGKEFIM